MGEENYLDCKNYEITYKVLTDILINREKYKEKRDCSRVKLNCIGNVKGENGYAVIKDISRNGMLIEYKKELSINDEIELDILEKVVKGKVIRKEKENIYGIEITENSESVEKIFKQIILEVMRDY